MTDFVEEIASFLASFSPDEQALSRYAFHALLEGRAVEVGDLPGALGLAPAAVRVALARLVERGTVAVEPDPDRIVGVRGLTLVESGHRLTLGGRRLYAWCAVDAVGIPAALGGEARVESRCHHCGVALAITLRDGAVVDAPAGMVLWVVERDLSRSLRAHT